MEPPQIRISRFEHSVAVRWDGDENWYRFEPDDFKYGLPGTERFKVGPLPEQWKPDGEWLDPLDDPRPDIRRWTEPIRRALEQALRLLDEAEKHPWRG
ncbi:hypothetical protein ACFWWS_35600 [Streptomyces sp. NPDC059083]|uniref:hypothetical protein n=1 Tax=Streptomyces sp. NPDC059083 TaxID=3346721 RepID=UPI0036A06790